jgi:hypothetical protein
MVVVRGEVVNAATTRPRGATNVVGLARRRVHAPRQTANIPGLVGHQEDASAFLDPLDGHRRSAAPADVLGEDGLSRAGHGRQVPLTKRLLIGQSGVSASRCSPVIGL